MTQKQLEKFLKWVDEKTTFFQDKDVTISQVTDLYYRRFIEGKKLKQSVVIKSLPHGHKTWEEIESKFDTYYAERVSQGEFNGTKYQWFLEYLKDGYHIDE